MDDPIAAGRPSELSLLTSLEAELERALAAKDRAAAIRAVKALGDSGDARATAGLLRMYRLPLGPKEPPRMLIVEALSKLGCREIVPDLCRIVTDAHKRYWSDPYGLNACELSDKFITAVEALERIGDAQALPTLQAIRIAPVSDELLASHNPYDDADGQPQLFRQRDQHRALNKAIVALAPQ